MYIYTYRHIHIHIHIHIYTHTQTDIMIPYLSCDIYGRAMSAGSVVKPLPLRWRTLRF